MRMYGHSNKLDCAVIVIVDKAFQENAKFLDKFEQPPLDEADVVPWMHVRAPASDRENAE